MKVVSTIVHYIVHGSFVQYCPLQKGDTACSGVPLSLTWVHWTWVQFTCVPWDASQALEHIAATSLQHEVLVCQLVVKLPSCS